MVCLERLHARSSGMKYSSGRPKGEAKKTNK